MLEPRSYFTSLALFPLALFSALFLSCGEGEAPVKDGVGDDVASEVVEIPVTCEQGGASIAAAPLIVEFEALAVGARASKTFQVRNLGVGGACFSKGSHFTLEPSSAPFEVGPLTVDGVEVEVLAPGSTAAIELTFAPSAAGVGPSTLWVVSDNAGTASVVLHWEATGATVPEGAGEFLTAYFNELCRLDYECCDAYELEDVLGPTGAGVNDVTGCIEHHDSLVNSILAERYDGVIARGAAAFDSAAAAACLAKLSSFNCASFTGLKEPEECGLWLRPLGALGDECEYDYECAEGYCSNTIPGSCKAHSADGDLCEFPWECGPGLMCSEMAVPPQCRPKHAVGGSCYFATDCASGICAQNIFGSTECGDPATFCDGL